MHPHLIDSVKQRNANSMAIKMKPSYAEQIKPVVHSP